MFKNSKFLNFRIPLVSLAVVGLVLFFQNCGKFAAVGPNGMDLSSTSGAGAVQIGTQQILERSCASCHDYATLTDQQLVASGLIVPGDPENSPIYYRLINSAGARGSKNMPKSGAALTKAEVAVLEDWIRSVR